MAPKKTARSHVKKAAEPKPAVTNKNGKKAESSSGGSSFFTWFMVLALLGVWTSVAVVYFDLVDYQGVLGKLVAYDTDGDGDFDVEDAKVLLDETPAETSNKALKRDPLTKDVGWKLREALKQQLVMIHERVEARRIAKLALAEVRKLLAKEEEGEKTQGLKLEEVAARAKEKIAARLKEEEEEMGKAMEELEKEKQGKVEEEKREEEEQKEKEQEEEEEEEVEEEEEEGQKKGKKGDEKKEERVKGRERGKRGKAEKDKGGRK